MYLVLVIDITLTTNKIFNAGIQFRLGSSSYQNIFENVLVYDNILGKLDTTVEENDIRFRGGQYMSIK